MTDGDVIAPSLLRRSHDADGGRARAPLERCDPGEPLFDYVLHPYRTDVAPAGKLRSLNLLVESFALSGVEREGLAVVEAVRGALGPHRTVWGAKLVDGRVVGWELYFYDYERKHADLSLERMVACLAPHLVVDAVEPFPLPWHMFSIELDAAALRSRTPVPAHVYVDMRSYELRGRELLFENVYTFHDPKLEIDDVLHRLQSSLHFDARHQQVATLVPAHLRVAHRICVANKRCADAIYFSRVPTSALETFLREHHADPALLAWVTRHAAELDHLRWDVGVDFTGGGRAIEVRKLGLYGAF